MARADNGTQPAADRPVGAQRVEPGGGQHFGDLQALTQTVALRGTRVLESDLVVAPRRRVRTTKPARAIRQSSLSR